MIHRAGVLTVAAAAFILTGCEEWGDWGSVDRHKEDFQQSHAMKPGGRLSLENMNGSVEIYGWDENKVEITGTKYARSEQALQALKIDIVASGDSVRIRTVPPSGHRGGMGARYVIHVPRKIEIDRVASSNGRVHLEGVDATARLRTSNGAVRILRVKGAVEVDTSNGSVELTEHTGPAVLHTSNGAIRADGVRGQFEATTSNGSITANISDPEPSRPVKLDTSNGSINLTMAAVRGNDIHASTSNSSITLKLPANVGAQLKARTSNSSVTTEFDTAVKGTISKNLVEGVIGSGGPLIDLSSSNGAIRVLRM